ncbi:hypothetical protein HDU76_009659, partial [Blyttiomyces sp. JEL0837]
DSYSCNGPKWNVSGLKEDTIDGPFYYEGNYFSDTLALFSNYFTNLTVGGFTARNMSLGGSTNTYSWYPYLGDGVLGLCNPANYHDYYPTYLYVEWFYQLGFTGDAGRFAIFLPKYGAGNVGELTIGGTNPARYKGSIQWVDAKPIRTDVWIFSASTIRFSFGSNNFDWDPPNVERHIYLDMIYLNEAIFVNEHSYFAILSSLNAVYDAAIKLYTVKCELRHSAPAMTFTFDNKTTLSIPADA